MLFTNPVCSTYAYDEPVERVGGGTVATKPKNVYCTGLDSEASGSRKSSPQSRILDWLADVGEGDEVFLTYLSFSDQLVADALCEAEAKGAEVTFVLDSMSSKAEQVEKCGGDILIRGHQGSIQFAHTKILMINPRAAGPADADDEFIRMSFGSGNMSSGTHLHHENWHFMEVKRDSFFVQSHLCLMDALIPKELTNGKTPFRTFMNECRAKIEFPPEDDMRAFFIPVREDSTTLVDLMVENIGEAETIDLGAHRFSFREMIDALEGRLSDADRPFHLRVEADDDLYWLGPLAPSKAAVLGPNTNEDLIKLQQLRDADDGRGRFEEKYLETNHALHLLHHNKYLVFHGMDSGRDALIVGSSNLTGTGFNDNLENMYWTDIPEIVDAFAGQFELFWDGEGPLPEGHDVAPLATDPQDMPVEVITLSTPSEPVDPEEPATCGIRIAEVLYDPKGSDDGAEWVKLYNSCDAELELDGMSLAWAGSRWTSAGLDLEGRLAGGECLVVGAMGLELDFSPDLQNSGTEADGVAVFGVPRAMVGASTVPVDAVIYGGENSSKLIDHTGQSRAPHVADVVAGETILRTNATMWTRSATPQPDACPDF